MIFNEGDWDRIQRLYLGDGIYYLPDFLLHNVFVKYPDDSPINLWIEIKENVTENDAEKIQKFCYAKEDYTHNKNDFVLNNPVIVLLNIPSGDNFGDLVDDMWDMWKACHSPHA